jgi:methyltransferase (TIGR00027 family)
LFHDPFARRLAGARGEAIGKALSHRGQMAWAIAIRTRLLDEMIERLVGEGGADSVLNLAAGLDSRPWRMNLPATLRWYDVDLPQIIDHKRGVLAADPPRCRLESRALDLTDADARQALLAEVASASRRTLVITEGLLIYLTDDEVAALARDLHEPPALEWWLMDIVSPELLRRLQASWERKLRAGNAPLRFAPAAGTRFFEPFGWKEQDFRSFWGESRRLRRDLPMAWLWRLLASFAPPQRRAVFHRLSGIAQLRRAGSG